MFLITNECYGFENSIAMARENVCTVLLVVQGVLMMAAAVFSVFRPEMFIAGLHDDLYRMPIQFVHSLRSVSSSPD